MSANTAATASLSGVFQHASPPSPTKAKPKPKPLPFSLRFTEEERERLLHRAGTLSLAAYIRLQLFRDFDGAPPPRKKLTRKVKMPSAELVVLGTMLGGLGQSRLASNLNQIARAANQGALPVTPELETELHEACTAIKDMRETLINALGVKVQ